MFRALVFSACLLLANALAPAAFAHAHLRESSPGANATLTLVPTQVDIWFTEKLEPDFSKVEVTGPGGARIDKNDAHLAANDPRHMIVTIEQAGPGTYTVTWHATSVDSHKTEGKYTYQIVK